MIALPSLVALALLVPAPVTSGPAGTFDRSLVPADAPFLIHVDFRALLDSELMSAFRPLLEAELDVEELEEIEARFGIDPLRDLHAVTIFSAGDPGEDAVLVLRTSARIDDAVARLRAETDLREGTLEGRRVYGFDDAFGHIAAGRNANERLVVLSEDEEQLWRAIQVIEGSAPSLAQAKDSDLPLAARKGAFVQVAFTDALQDFAAEMGGPASRIGELAQGFGLQLGEDRGVFFVDVRVETGEAEGATQIVSVLEGLRSLATMMGEELPPGSRDLLDEVDFDAVGSRVEILFERPVKLLLQDFQRIQSGR